LNAFSKLTICTALLMLQVSTTFSYAKTLTQPLLALNEEVIPIKQSPRVRERIISDLKNNVSLSKTLRVKLIELNDNQGLKYLGVNIPKAELVEYLAQMKLLLPNNYSKYRENQSKRDHGVFHLTLVNPFEYQLLNKSSLKLGTYLNVTLVGLGKVCSDKELDSEKKTTYYVVANSNDGQFYRQKLLLKPKDFHVTLGFDPSDVYNQAKGQSTLIQP